MGLLMKFQQLRFANRQGHNLSARLDLPEDGKPHAYAIFAHCFTCTKDLKAVTHINLSLTRNGIAVLRFDFTGLGHSEGDFAETNFTTNVSDLIDAAQYLSKHYSPPRLLVGHSLGGAAVLRAAAEIESATAVAVIGTPSKTDQVLRHLSGATKEIEAAGEAEISLAGRPFRIKKQFLDDLKSERMTDSVKSLKRALLVLHSPADRIVDIGNAMEIFQVAGHPKSFISLDTADHLLSASADSRYAGTMIAAWSGKYIAGFKVE